MNNGFNCNKCGIPLDCNKECKTNIRKSMFDYGTCQCFKCFLSTSKKLEYSYSYIYIKAVFCYNTINHDKELKEYETWFNGVLVALHL